MTKKYQVIWKPYPSYDGYIKELITTRVGEEGIKNLLMYREKSITHNQLEIKSIELINENK